MKEFEEWFKTKKYPHIGYPITIKDYNRVKAYIDNPFNIRKHSFLPFIHKTIVKRRFRANKENPSVNPSGKKRRIRTKPKIRDTFFSSHLDAMIFSKYNSILSEAYETYIKDLPFNESIVAYRKIPIVPGKKGNKCNIDYAKSAFEYISNNKDKKLSVIVADVSSFFDNLDHKILKTQWSRILNQPTLPPDHYNIFKALTRIKYVESRQLFDAYDQTMIVERGVPNSSKRKTNLRKKIKSVKYFKEKRAIAYCDKKEFIKNNLGLIISKNNCRGIPQGSPISATLANTYMLNFDEKMFKEIAYINGFYQRYSDDLIIVCERKYEEKVIKILRYTISGDASKLEIQPDKTKLYHFETQNGVFKCFVIDETTRQLFQNKQLEYLGFSFDGNRVLIKASGFSKFYRSMKGAFNRSLGFALFGKNPDRRLFKSKLYKRFTYKGAKRKIKFRPSANNPKQYLRTKEYNWGNYLSYVNKADESMFSLNSGNCIKKQSRKAWARFDKLMKLNEKRLKPNCE